ncbi:response regulator transcription factor [Bradyrhizobium canariense]|uniref:Response regulator receiver domain-containing protein n=1 Tax=Bradyrhizobium canariense TaxID=255045 RepID=A0A1H1T0H3_9BRAD|nr:response regulator [Bradyrhizobium canariense]SDS53671.1 Response regulator receiver domain-containing protein [Bradyrhizobium canariense]
MAIDRAPKFIGRPAFSPLRFGDLRTSQGLSPVTIPFIAVVDDDEALCSSLVDLMRSIGYRAEPFASAEAFLVSPNRFGLHCIIADIHMPGMGGLNLLRALHEQGIVTPVVLITALTDKHLDEEAASRGALCLLRKPFEISSLLDHIDRSLRQ